MDLVGRRWTLARNGEGAIQTLTERNLLFAVYAQQIVLIPNEKRKRKVIHCYVNARIRTRKITHAISQPELDRS